MAPDYYHSVPSDNSPIKVTYRELMNHSVHTIDDIDIGDIFAVNKQFIVVVRGFLNIHYYYIPLNKVEGWDGNVLWINKTEEEVKRSYERHTYPDSSRYFVKDDFPYEHIPLDFPEPIIINSKSKRVGNFQKNKENVTTTITTSDDHSLLPSSTDKHNSLLHTCDLCIVSFESEEDLKNHVLKEH